jgi:polyisoprenoid-binding protein YceI
MTSTTDVPTATTWRIDPTHTIAAFAVQHMGMSTFRGRFRTVEGGITLDEATPANSSVTATLDVNSLDVLGERFVQAMMRAEHFHVEEHPTITFRSTRVERGADDRHWTVYGDLTIRGITHEVALAAEYLGRDKHPFSGRTVAAFRAETEIDRGDYGMQWNAALESGRKYLGERVRITLDIEAVREDEPAPQG